MLKTIGILGGMGPAATVDLMNRIISMTDAECDQDHIPMLVDNNTRIPDRTDAILHGGASPVPEMLASAKRLEAAGADFLVIPCHTAHYFIPQIADKIGIPILDMPTETAKLLKIKGVNRASVLATDGTVQSDLYGAALERISEIFTQRHIEASVDEVFALDDVNKALKKVAGGKSKSKTIIKISAQKKSSCHRQ
jgi:aspartate racemase